MRHTAATLFLFSIVAIGAAQRIPPAPVDTYVRDEAHVMSTADVTRVRRDAAQMLRITGAPVVVCTIPSLAAEQAHGLTIEKYATLVFDKWGIGSQAQNYGVLLLVSVGDRRARIQFGAGWKHKYDSHASQVMQGTIIPQFRIGHYSHGIAGGVDSILGLIRQDAGGRTPETGSSNGIPMPARANPNPVETMPDPSQVGRNPVAGLAFVQLCCCAFPFLVVIAIVTRSRGQRGRHSGGSSSIGPNSFTPDSTGGSFDSSSGGDSGGGGFDGGSSDGGGASGSW